MKPTYLSEKKRMRQIIDSIPWNEAVNDHPELIRVLRHHKDWSSKTNNGQYTVIKKKTSERRGMYCLQIYDGERHVDDISLDVAIRCTLGLKIPQQNKRAILQKAFRNEIKHQISDARGNASVVDVDVDHANVDFVQMTRDFLHSEGIAEEDVEIEYANKGDWNGKFKDRDFALRWQEYHNSNAILSVIPIHQHMVLTQERKKQRLSTTPLQP